MSVESPVRGEMIRLSINRRTGARHVADPDSWNPVCGAKPHAPTYEEERGLLSEFPEDFGQLPKDCDRCAEIDCDAYFSYFIRLSLW